MCCQVIVVRVLFFHRSFYGVKGSNVQCLYGAKQSRVPGCP